MGHNNAYMILKENREFTHPFFCCIKINVTLYEVVITHTKQIPNGRRRLFPRTKMRAKTSLYGMRSDQTRHTMFTNPTVCLVSPMPLVHIAIEQTSILVFVRHYSKQELRSEKQKYKAKKLNYFCMLDSVQDTVLPNLAISSYYKFRPEIAVGA